MKKRIMANIPHINFKSFTNGAGFPHEEKSHGYGRDRDGRGTSRQEINDPCYLKNK